MSTPTVADAAVAGYRGAAREPYDSVVGASGLDAPLPRSLVWATHIEVLPVDRVVQRRDGYLVVRSPSNPTHWWGNQLLFDAPPLAGDAERWESLFAREFADQPAVRHVTLAWDGVDGELGRAREDFVERGYRLDQAVGLVAEADRLRPHARANREVVVRALDPAAGADEELWEQVVQLQVACRDEHLGEGTYRDYSRRRQAELRLLFGLGRGAWYVALDPGDGEVAASCGVVVTGGRGRYQQVETRAAQRRRGICSRLLIEAARASAREHGARRFVIAADPDYHALGLYESLGFERRERTAGVWLEPPRAAASQAPPPAQALDKPPQI
jgi:ribosomal protein S18 acetylase RimI-like enzyme